MLIALRRAVRKRTVPKPWRVLLRAHSMHLVYVATALEIASNAVPYMAGIIPWWVIVAVLVAAPVARIYSQGGIDADKQYRADEAR